MKKSPGRPKKNTPSPKHIEQWNEAQKPVVEDVTTFSGEFTTEDITAALHKAIDEGTFEINKPFAKVEAGAQLVSGGVSDKGIVHGYNTPHGGIEFIPDDIFQALKKHLLIEGFVSTQNLVKTIEPELSAIFAEGKADNVADGIKIFLNQ